MAKYKDWICRYYANHDDIPAGKYDGELMQELVRCRNCTHWAKDKTMKNVGKCFVGREQWIMHADGYCSEAEKRILLEDSEDVEITEEIVRCKDCKHWIRMRDRWFCSVHGSYQNCTPEDFCSRGRAK